MATGCDTAPHRRRLAEAAVFLLIAMAIGWFYLWSARTEDASWHFGQRQTDYYNLLVDGMLKGHVSLDVAVPPDLLVAKNPYDPATRPPGIALHDASLYRGKYYLYFGVAPVVTLLLPFRLLTHAALPLPLAVVVFAYAGFLAAAVTWWLVRRRYFPQSSIVLGALMLAALGTVSMAPVLVRRANVWELPLASGYCFAALAVLCVYRSVHAQRSGEWWFAAAGLALGLAVASRPTYLFGAGLMVVPLLWKAGWLRFGDRRRSDGPVALTEERPPGTGGRERGALLRYAVAGLVPLVAVGIAMAAYNYARFGNPLEFGVSYQLSGLYEVKARHFSSSYLAYNLRLYAFGPFDWSRYFPFIHDARLPATPKGHFGVEEVCGVLKHMVLLWCVLAAPLAWWRRGPDEQERLLSWALAVGALGTGTLLTLGFFYAVVGRYESDFMPSFTLLAGVGVLGIERWARERARHWAVFVRTALAIVVATSAGFAVLFSLVLYGNFQRSNPRAYAGLAHFADYPAYWLEQLSGDCFGAFTMTVRFPVAPTGKREPLLCAGPYGAEDHIFVEYGTAHRVRFGYAHDFGGQFYSAWIEVPADTTHHLRIAMGSLYPPEEAPSYHGLPMAVAAQITRRVRVEFDGRPVIDRYCRFESVAPGRVRIGSDDKVVEYGSPFTGEIVGLSRDGNLADAHGASLAPSRGMAADGPPNFDQITMQIGLPAQRTVGAREPIVITGVTGGADFLYIEYLDGRRVRFGLEHWGKPGIFSPPIDWPGSAERTAEIALGSFPGASRPDGVRPDRVLIRLDGVVVWSSPARFYIADHADVFVGRNPVGGTACAPRFSGTISEVRRLAK